MVTAYNVITSDGFVASKDGNEEFIPDYLWESFIDECRERDVVVFGRKTYEAIQKYEYELVERFEKLPVKKIVVSRDPNFLPKPGYDKVSNLADAIKTGKNILISSGPSLTRAFL